MSLLLVICESFKEERCEDRLSVYVEKEGSKEKAIVESIACPFYEDGNCRVGGWMELYTKKHINYQFTKKKTIN